MSILNRRTNLVLQAAISCWSLHSATAAGATFYSWNTYNGTWSTSTNWTPTGPPTASDYAIFYTSYYTVTLSADESVSSINVNASGSGGGTFNVSGFTLSTNSLSLADAEDSTLSLSGSGTLLAANVERIGATLKGTFTQISATNSMYELAVGSGADSSGSNYALSGGTLLASTERIGLSNFGSITQTGGVNSASADLDLGFPTGGTYTISGGVLTSPIIDVGGNPYGTSGSSTAGTFSVQSGANVTAGALTVFNSNSVVNLSGGRLTVGTLNLSGNASRMNWTGGQLVINQAVPATDGPLTVPKSGTLSGTGNIKRALTVAGTLAPGDPSSNSTGSLTVSSTLSLQPASQFSVRVGDTSMSSDELFIGSGFAASTISLANVSLVVTPLSNVVLGQSYTIIDASNDAVSNPFVGTFSQLSSTSPATYTVNVNQTDKVVSVVFTSVPEPATALLMPVILLARRRSRIRIN